MSSLPATNTSPSAPKAYWGSQNRRRGDITLFSSWTSEGALSQKVDPGSWSRRSHHTNTVVPLHPSLLVSPPRRRGSTNLSGAMMFKGFMDLRLRGDDSVDWVPRASRGGLGEVAILQEIRHCERSEAIQENLRAAPRKLKRHKSLDLFSVSILRDRVKTDACSQCSVRVHLPHIAPELFMCKQRGIKITHLQIF